MAHYRKLHIGNDTFRYNIGKRFVNINSDNGNRNVEIPDIGFKIGINWESKKDNYVITPKMVVHYIIGKLTRNPADYFETCDCEGVSKELGVDPFRSEIGQKTIYVYWCQHCYDRSAGDI